MSRLDESERCRGARSVEFYFPALEFRLALGQVAGAVLVDPHGGSPLSVLLVDRIALVIC
jgi:hypothetical protein